MKNRFLASAFRSYLATHNLEPIFKSEEEINEDKDIQELVDLLMFDFEQITDEETLDEFAQYVDIMMTRDCICLTEASRSNLSLKALGVFCFLTKIVDHANRPPYLKGKDTTELVKHFSQSVQYLVSVVAIYNNILYSKDYATLVAYIDKYLPKQIKNLIPDEKIDALYKDLDPIQLAEMGQYKCILDQINDDKHIMTEYFNFMSVCIMADVAIAFPERHDKFDYDQFEEVIKATVKKAIDSEFFYNMLKETIGLALNVVSSEWLCALLKSQIKVLEKAIEDEKEKERLEKERLEKLKSEGKTICIANDAVSTIAYFDGHVKKEEFKKLENKIDGLKSKVRRIKISGGY